MRNLKQHVTVPTHRIKHTLDMVVTGDDKEVLLEYSVRDPCLSDHFFVHCQLSIDRLHPAKVEKINRKRRNVDTDVFRRDLAISELLSSPAENVSDLCSQYAETALSFWFQGESIGLV